MNHKGTKTLETGRLRLRPFELSDNEDMYNNWANDDAVTKHLTWPTHTSIEVTDMVLESWVKGYVLDTTYSWAIELKEEGKVIGSIGVVEFKEENEQCSIGYCIGSEFWNKGITSEAFGVIIDFLFDEVGFERIQAYHHSDNPASGKVMMKVGMKHEGCLRHYTKKTSGIYVDCDIYGILKDDQRQERVEYIGSI